MTTAFAFTPDLAASDILVRRFARCYGPLTAREEAVLHRLGADQRRLEPGERLVQEGGLCDDFFVLCEGAMHSSTLLKGGARQILRLHHPGDLMNVTAVGWSRVAATLTACTPVMVTSFARQQLQAVFTDEPRLAAMLYGICTIDNVRLNDRLKSLGRTDGRARIAELLLELQSRQNLTDGADPDEVELFLTQGDIADAVGMTKVHVNRLLRELTTSGLIAREGRRVRLLDRPALVEACDYVDRYADMANDWLPGG